MADQFNPLPVRPPKTLQLGPLGSQPRQLVSFKTYASHKLNEPVTHLDISPVEPYEVAASHGFAVSLLALRGGSIRKSFSRFRGHAYSPAYKRDGRLLAVGLGDGDAKIISIDNGTPLRELRGHKAAVRSCRFTIDGSNLLTGSDDHTVRIWDVASGTPLYTLTEATDYVRCQNSSPASEHVWITGSADHKARLYDLRTPRCIFTIDHGAQVDNVHILPGGAQALTVGGLDVKVWDFFKGGKMQHSLQSHSKAVTSVAIDAPRRRLITAGLDGYVKYHDLSSFELRGILPCDGQQILAVAASPDGKTVAIGTAAGHLQASAMRNHAERAQRLRPTVPGRENELQGLGRGFVTEDDDSGPSAGSRRYFSRGPAEPAPADALVIERNPYLKLQKHDTALRSYNFSEAIDLAFATQKAEPVLAVINELIMRGSLEQALKGREPEDVTRLVSFAAKHIRKPAYKARLLFLLNVVLDLHVDFVGADEKFDAALRSALCTVRTELELCRELQIVRGSVETVKQVASLN